MNITKIIFTTLLTMSELSAMQQDLFDAAKSGNFELTQQLIEQRADINAQDPDDLTPLMYAASYGHMRIAELLIEHNAPVNPQDTDTDVWTPLMEAASSGHTDIAELLIKKQANVNAQEHYGWTPLMSAVLKDHTNMVRAILHARADLYVQNEAKDTARAIAYDYNKTEIIKMIEQESCRRLQEEVQLRTTAQTLCAIRTHEPSSILSLIPNELLFLILGHISPYGFERLLPQNHDQK
jgi:ankyrin repeat protein